MDINMVECLECGSLHSERVSKCPECGYGARRKRPAVFVIGMIFLGIMFIVPTLMPIFGYFAMNKQDESIDKFEQDSRTQNGRFQVSAPNLAQYLKLRPEKLNQEAVEIFGMIKTVEESENGQLLFTFDGAESLAIKCKQKERVITKAELIFKQPTILGGIFQTYQADAGAVWINPCIVFQVNEKQNS